MAFGIKQIKAFLSEKGMPIDSLDTAAEELCARHKADIDAIREERDEYKQKLTGTTTLREENEKLKAELDKANATIKQAEEDDYKGKYESEKAEKEKIVADYEAQQKEAKENAAIADWASENGYSDEGVKKIVKYGGLRGKIKLTDDGKLEMPDELKSSIEGEWGGFKKPAETLDIAKIQKPPANAGTKSTKTKAEIMQIKDTNERQKAIAENLELFGVEKE